MEEIEILENLLESAKKITYENKDEFDILEKRTEMLVRKIFGDESHYLQDLKNISYYPMIYTLEGPNDYRPSFESGLKQFRTLIHVMIEDAKLSSNYPDTNSTKFIKPTINSRVVKVAHREITFLSHLLLTFRESANYFSISLRQSSDGITLKVDAEQG